MVSLLNAHKYVWDDPTISHYFWNGWLKHPADIRHGTLLTSSTATGQKWFSWHGFPGLHNGREVLGHLLRPPTNTHLPGVEVINQLTNDDTCEIAIGDETLHLRQDIWKMGLFHNKTWGGLNRSRMQNSTDFEVSTYWVRALLSQLDLRRWLTTKPKM